MYYVVSSEGVSGSGLDSAAQSVHCSTRHFRTEVCEIHFPLQLHIALQEFFTYMVFLCITCALLCVCVRNVKFKVSYRVIEWMHSN